MRVLFSRNCTSAHLPSLANIKPSRKFPNLQYLAGDMNLLYNLFQIMSIGEGIIPRINNIKEGDVFRNLRHFHNVLSHMERCKFRPQGYKTFFMLNSTEHEISTAHKTLMLKM